MQEDPLAELATNYDEARAGDHPLPDPLRFNDGKRVVTARDWPRRRAEILRQFEANMFGAVPAGNVIARVELQADDPAGLDGQASSRQVRLRFEGAGHSCHMDLLIYLPAQRKGPVPVLMGLNFGGNQTIHPDPQIWLTPSWVGGDDPQASPASRGVGSSRWPVERILERGYGLVTAYYGDLDPDFDDGFQNGIHPLFYRPGQARPLAGEWGSVSVWAWGLSRALDYLESYPDVDAARVAVLGHSRLGKAALWAGARDERFGLVISNNSGCGGAALSRRNFGETVSTMNRSFPHWYCEAFKQYSRQVSALPIDQHELIALVAPRPVYVASAAEDLWADPRGEFLAAFHAGPVFRLLGETVIETDTMPALEQPLMTTVGYHIRRGGHDVTPYDWECFMDFADLHLG